MLPLVLAGAGLGSLHAPRRALAVAVLAGLVLVTGWRSQARFGERNEEGGAADTLLRLAEEYGAIADSLAASPEGLQGDLLVLTPLGPKPGAVPEPLRGGPLDTQLVFTPIEKATFGGLGVRLLHRDIESIDFSNELWPRLDWEDRELWITTGRTTLQYLRRGFDGRAARAAYYLERHTPLRARHEATALLKLVYPPVPP